MVSPQRLFLADDGETIVAASDPRARRLIVGAGCEVDEVGLAGLGLTMAKVKAGLKALEAPDEPEGDEVPVRKAVDIPPATKAVKGPPETKGR
jgi:hypothetical protein